MNTTLAGMELEAIAFPPDLSAQIQTLLEREIFYGENAGSPPFVCDLKFFRKPTTEVLNNELISTKHLVELFHWVKSLYPEELAYAEINEYWDELDLFRNTEMEDRSRFRAYFSCLFLEPESYDAEDPEEALLEEREQIIEHLLDFCQPLLFGDEPDYEVSLYCLTDDNNENTAYAPYVFVGKQMMMVALRRWIL
jgi:hypothetical protein